MLAVSPLYRLLAFDDRELVAQRHCLPIRRPDVGCYRLLYLADRLLAQKSLTIRKS